MTNIYDNDEYINDIKNFVIPSVVHGIEEDFYAVIHKHGKQKDPRYLFQELMKSYITILEQSKNIPVREWVKALVNANGRYSFKDVK